MWREERREGPAISGSTAVGWGMPQDRWGGEQRFETVKERQLCLEGTSQVCGRVDVGSRVLHRDRPLEGIGTLRYAIPHRTLGDQRHDPGLFLGRPQSLSGAA